MIAERARDDVTRILDRARALVRGRPIDAAVDALLADIDALDVLAFVSLDERSRTWGSGVGAGEIARLRSGWRRVPRYRLWAPLALMSADGHERERAIDDAELTATTTALLALRAPTGFHRSAAPRSRVSRTRRPRASSWRCR